MSVSTIPGIRFIDKTHRAFDPLLDWVLATCSYAAYASFYQGNNIGTFDRVRTWKGLSYKSMQFAGNVSGKNLVVIPHETFIDVTVNGNKSTSIAYLEQNTYEDFSGHNINTPTVIGGFVGLMLVSYYESQIDSVIERYSSAVSHWPAVWKFARIVRNAVSHDGKVHIRNPNEPSVTYFGLTYSQADNGRTIIHSDLSIADVFFLVLEMDLAL